MSIDLPRLLIYRDLILIRDHFKPFSITRMWLRLLFCVLVAIVTNEYNSLTGPEDMDPQQEDTDCGAEWTSESRDEEEDEEEDEYYIPGHYQVL